MSHANGQVKFQDGTIMHFEYDGTSDVVIPKIYPTKDEMLDNWRRGRGFDERQKCIHEEENVEIAHSYGYGSYMTGRACRKCNCITFDYESYEEHRRKLIFGNWGLFEKPDEEYMSGWVEEGLPDWWV